MASGVQLLKPRPSGLEHTTPNLMGCCHLSVESLGNEDARAQWRVPRVPVLVVAILIPTGDDRNLLLVEGVPEVHVFLRYVDLRAVLVHCCPRFRLHETHITPLPVGATRVCCPDDMVDGNVVEASIAEPQGWDPHTTSTGWG